MCQRPDDEPLQRKMRSLTQEGLDLLQVDVRKCDDGAAYDAILGGHCARALAVRCSVGSLEVRRVRRLAGQGLSIGERDGQRGGQQEPGDQEGDQSPVWPDEGAG